MAYPVSIRFSSFLKALFVVLLYIVIFCMTGCEKPKSSRHLLTETIKIESLKQIVLVDSVLVRPLLYTHVSGLDRVPTREAKARFISAVLPSILVAKYKIDQNRKRLEGLRIKTNWDGADSTFVTDMRKRYKARNTEELLYRMGTLPNSIVLAQAAIESAWGQSRFFLEGSNLFGVWSYNPYEPRIAAARTRMNQKRIYLRAYPDMSESITHYFEILSKANAYRTLRKARLETSDPFKLLPHLQNFSERRTFYTNQLKKVIIRDNLTQYDQHQIDPKYFVEE
jgi:Bax protein